MRHYAILKLLLAAFLLYLAWSHIPEAVTATAKTFWVGWLGFFLLVTGGNLATILKITDPPIMEQQNESSRERLES